MMLKKNRVVRNAAWIISCRIVQAMLSFVIGILCARYLGPSNYGAINYASSIAAFMIPVVQLGLRSTLVHEIISNPEKEGMTLGTSMGMSALASFLGIGGIVAFTSIANRNEPDTIIVCALYSISLIFQSLEMIEYWFQAKLLSKYVAFTSLFAYTMVSIYRIFLLVTGKSVFWFALSQTIDYCIIDVLLVIFYKKIGKTKLSFSVEVARNLFSRSRYYIVSGIMVTFYSLTDRVMITIMLGEEANGYYAAAVTCADISRFIFAAIVDSARPSIFEAKKEGVQNYERKISKLFSIITYLGLVQSIFLTATSNIIVYILYGTTYYPAVNVLKIITWYTAFAYIGSVRNIWILAEQKQKVLWKINLTGAVLNVIANYALIPILGIEGAAIASVVAHFFTNLILCFVLKPIRPVSKLIWEGVNPLNLKNLWGKKAK